MKLTVLLCFLIIFGTAESSAEEWTIRGTVLRIDGRPVRGAWIKLIQRETGGLLFPRGQELLDAKITSDRGTFILRSKKWKPHAAHELIVGGKSKQRPPIRGESVTRYYVLTTRVRVDVPNLVIVPNDFVPSQRNPRKGLLDPRAYEKR